MKRWISLVKGGLAPLMFRPQTRRSVGEVLARQARRMPEKPLFLFEGRTVTYREANELANRYAHLFQARGFKKGETVALLMENRPEFLIIHAGLAKIGVVPALLNTHIRGGVLAHAINIVEARALIVGVELLEAFEEVKGDVRLESPASLFLEKEGQTRSTPDSMEDLEPSLAGQPVHEPTPDSPMVISDTLEYIYTSGTTGMPKATVLAHRKWFQLGYAAGGFAVGATSDDVQYVCLPLYHNSGVNLAWPITLLWGGTMSLVRRFSVSRFWEDVRRHNASLFVYVGELCRYLHNLPERPDDADNPLEIIIGNGMRGEYWEAFQKRFAIKRIVEGYASTEGVGGMLNRKGVPGMIGQLSIAGLIRMGEVAKCDAETGELSLDDKGYCLKCREGETGMFLARVGRLNHFSGYKNNTRATSDKLRNNVFKPGDAYFVSGDLVMLHPKGYLSFVDRLGDTFRWKGEVVSTNEVGDVLFRFGGMEEANVYGVEVAGTEGRAGMAAVTPLNGADIDLDGLAAWVVEKLPSYARPWFLRILDEKASTATFKQKKVALRREGFDPQQIDDRLYFLDPESRSYVPMTPDLHAGIESGAVRF